MRGVVRELLQKVRISIYHIPPTDCPYETDTFGFYLSRPTESFFLQAFGVDAHLAPNHEDGSCLMTFGEPAPVDDPAFQEPCYVTCVNAKDTGSRGDSGKDTSGGSCGPCPKLGNQRS